MITSTQMVAHDNKVAGDGADSQEVRAACRIPGDRFDAARCSGALNVTACSGTPSQ